MDAAEIERLLDAPATRAAPSADLTGPVTVLASESRPDGATRVDIQASRLVPVDPDDPALAEVSMPVPMLATVVVDGAGRLEAVETKPLDAEVERQARAFARNLVANGAVRGLAASGRVRRGPPSRPTHEVALDGRGRKVIRRIGFATTLDPKAQHGPTSHHQTGGTKDA
jgi:hypothetical protein